MELKLEIASTPIPLESLMEVVALDVRTSVHEITAEALGADGVPIDWKIELPVLQTHQNALVLEDDLKPRKRPSACA